jgi:hypothetical protein
MFLQDEFSFGWSMNRHRSSCLQNILFPSEEEEDLYKYPESPSIQITYQLKKTGNERSSFQEHLMRYFVINLPKQIGPKLVNLGS